MLVIDRHFHAPRNRPVVIVSRQLFQVRLKGTVLDPPVKIKDSGAVTVYDLAGAHQPVLEIFLRRLRLAVDVLMIRLRHGRPVKIPPLHGFPDVAVKFLSMAHKKPVLYPVGGCAYLHSLFLTALLQLPKHVSFRPHLIGVPVGHLASVHLKSVMVLRHRHHIPGPRLFE